jgi:hypothetical protein
MKKKTFLKIGSTINVERKGERTMKMKFWFLMLGAVALALPAMAIVYPNSMAVIGDSISRGALADNTIDDDQPEHCWSTGDAADTCLSHLERIRQSNPSAVGYNNAWNGAQSDDLLAQANTTVTQGVQYVTIFIGGNDVCGDSTAEMTAVDVWTARWNEAIDVLQAGLPGADILALEVPKLRLIWDTGKGNFSCRYIKWPLFGFCKNLLCNGSTQLTEGAARNLEYNNALRTLCAAQGVWFDDDVYEYALTYQNLSTVDCFHPQTKTDGAIADITYDANRF